jgi:hypothetical protein
MIVRGSTPGAALGETTKLVAEANANIFLTASKTFQCTVKGCATVTGLGAAARQTIFFNKSFGVSFTSGGVGTLTAVTPVGDDGVVQGAGLVGATLVPTVAAGSILILTFAIAAGLQTQARCLCSLEMSEVLGT